MSARYNFTLESQDKRRDLPHKIIVGQNDTETVPHVVLKFLAYLLFFRERLQIEPNLHNDSIPFVPDLVQLDYELRPKLWIECGECSLGKLDKLAVKAPEAELWVVKSSPAEVEQLLRAMEKGDLRQGRYHVIGLDPEMIQELCGLLQYRNEVLWVSGEFDPPVMQFDFNGLWFDTAFTVARF
ncbi:MAG: YaeQ family protein [Verrucomicrobiota bacterium]